MAARTLLLAALVGLSMPMAFAQEGVRVGHIDSKQALLMLPQRKVAEEKMQRKAAEIDQRIKAMYTEYQETTARLQPQYASMSPVEQAQAQRDIKELEERIEAAQERAENDLEALQRELMEPMIKQVEDAIREVAGTNGFTYIIDVSSGMLLYYDRGEDILPLVKAKLGL